MVENSRDHKRARPKEAPALEQVVIVPGPINAADITDQNRTEEEPCRKEMNFGIGHKDNGIAFCKRIDYPPKPVCQLIIGIDRPYEDGFT